VVWGVVMVGSLGDNCGWDFCTGDCIASCTRFVVSLRCGVGWISVCGCFDECQSILGVLCGHSVGVG